MPLSFDNEHEIFHLAHKGDIAGVQAILDREPELILLKTKSNNETLLMLAAEMGHLQLVQLLVEKSSVNISDITTSGFDVLMLAIASGHLETVKWLIKPKPEGAGAENITGASLIHLAARSGHINIVQWLIMPLPEGGGAHISAKDDEGNTPLLFAAYQGRLNMVEWLLKPRPEGGGASITEINNNGDTPLLFAAREGRLGIVKWLLKPRPEGGGASITEKNSEGINALLYATYFGHFKTAQWLLKPQPQGGGFDINKSNTEEYSPLLIATEQGYLDLVKWMLTPRPDGGGACVAETDNEGKTPLLLATHNNHLNLIQWLLKPQLEGGGGASIKEHDKKGMTALLEAAALGSLETIQWLLKPQPDGGGAQITEKDEQGRSAPLWAATNGHFKAAAWLLNKYPDAIDDFFSAASQYILFGPRGSPENQVNLDKLVALMMREQQTTQDKMSLLNRIISQEASPQIVRAIVAMVSALPAQHTSYTTSINYLALFVLILQLPNIAKHISNKGDIEQLLLNKIQRFSLEATCSQEDFNTLLNIANNEHILRTTKDILNLNIAMGIFGDWALSRVATVVPTANSDVQKAITYYQFVLDNQFIEAKLTLYFYNQILAETLFTNLGEEMPVWSVRHSALLKEFYKNPDNLLVPPESFKRLFTEVIKEQSLLFINQLAQKALPEISAEYKPRQIQANRHRFMAEPQKFSEVDESQDNAYNIQSST